MAGNKHPERLVNFRVYGESNAYYGIATVELPEIEYMSDTVSGAGISGEIESPVIGHISAMEMTLSWRTIMKEAMALADSTKAHHLEIRGSEQEYDSATGTYSTIPVKVVVKAAPKTISLGSFEPGATTDTEQTFAVNYLKMTVNNEETLEFDPFGGKATVKGVNALDSVNRDLGLA